MNKQAELQRRLMDPETRYAAFEEAVRTYSPVLYNQIRRMVTWHDDADDVLQNTFLKAWQALGSYRGDSQVSTWLYRIAINESLTFLSKQKDSASLSDEETVAQVAARLESDPYFDGDETERQLQAALATLPDKQRLVFNMKYFEEMKYEDMSALLGTSVGALKASYHLAVKKIEQFFNEID
ncbi:MAG: sigma-70 family RNA polymerase sigma factor [Alloprevotella sp.]|nr:sigma-70 family RNA polymerase sigma factor [Alloprevotella sp.]